MSAAIRPAGLILLLACALVSFTAKAQEPPADDAQTTPPELSPEDRAAIEQSLSQDQKASEAAAPAQPSSASDSAESTAPAGGGSSVQSHNPDISLIADFALAYFSEEPNLETGAHDPHETGFNLQQLELSAGAAVDPYFRFDANIVFELFGVEIEEAYATTLDLPESLQLRAGQFLTRFGRLNATHPHSWEFVDQPFALGRVFGGEGNRGLGAELSWLSPLPWYVELVGSVTDAAGEGTARSFYGAHDLGIDGLGDFQYTVAIKQFFPLSDDWSLSFGLSGAAGPNPTGRNNHSDVYGVDIYLKWRPISYQSFLIFALQSEWLYRRRQIPATVLQDVNGYASASLRFAQRWSAAARYEYGSEAVDTNFDPTPDPLDPEWTEPRQRVAVDLTFYPTEFSRVRAQGAVDMPEWEAHPIWMAFLALEVVTGAHGAHPF